LKDWLFIGYSRADVANVDWIGRLRMYLEPRRNARFTDAWDVSRLQPGDQWIDEIREILATAKAAVLIVGPAFLASDFVMRHEVTDSLATACDKGLRVFPLITGFCGYEATDLGRYQAFNDHFKPLEALSHSAQNQVLNELCVSLNKALRAFTEPAEPGQKDIRLSLREAVLVLKDLLDTSHEAFLDQCLLRDALVRAIQERLDVGGELEYEKFFSRYFHYLTTAEKPLFERIRAITDVLHARNQEIVHTMDANPQLLDTFPVLTDLRQHLVFWLNKFDLIFAHNKAMCVLYTGVKDAVPFPTHVHDVIEDWLDGK
jgi:hypothetical protein